MNIIAEKEYLIDTSTLIVERLKIGKSKIYELNRSLLVNSDLNDIINDSCEFFGSSYDGRLKYSKRILNLNIKLPIIIEESKNIIFFPTKSINNEKCMWISFNNIEKIEKINHFTNITFKNGKSIKLDVSIEIISRQILNCLKLEKELNLRYKNS